MADLFDHNEELTIEKKLWEKYGHRSGMDRDVFKKHIETVFRGIRIIGFEKNRIKKTYSKDGGIPESLINMIWDDLARSAQKLANKSFIHGLWVTSACGVLLVVRLLPSDLCPSFIKKNEPDWFNSKWFMFLLGVGLLVGIVHVFRGFLSTRHLKR